MSTNLNMLDNEKIQNRLDKYFDSFREEEINGIRYNLMPPKTEVPLIKRVAYDRIKDVFEIVFEYKTKVNFVKQGNVIFIEDLGGRLVGIQVPRVREQNISQVTVEVIATLEQVIKGARVNLERKPNPKLIAELSLEERKTDFFKDIIQRDMPELVK